ncbi:hypothetical protein D9619_012436 [Psilocybe cf. subviscida]|uniref:Uncharacterized protein n=1 Tax=Psilocybe cf. subviscida TaxID=2480587 RepID=A0A8H5ARA8_9AGAR|nr:hypothetical protein D9619_012436 [Psilocybe cf. subviscida]
MEMVQQICEECMAADDDLHEYHLEHLTPDDAEQVSEWRAIHSLTGMRPLAPSFTCAKTGAITKSGQDVVSREHWTKWLDYLKEERTSALKTLRQKRSQTVQAFEEDIWEPSTPQACISN